MWSSSHTERKGIEMNNWLEQVQMRALGQNIIMSRAAWQELADELKEDSGLRRRIIEMLSEQ